jgi:hypothetical protein
MREWCAARWDRNEIRFYENDASEAGAHLAVRLVGNGTTTNRSALGARVTVTADDVSLTKELNGAYGHGAAQQDMVQFFGLGDCAAVSSIEVRWPDAAGTVERFEQVPAGGLVELRQGDPTVYPLEL